MKLRGIVGIACIVVTLVGCTVSPVEHAGGDDFPNMIAAAGKSIAGNLDQQWENPAAAASTDPLALLEEVAVPVLPELSLGKRMARAERSAVDTVHVTFDIQTGIATGYFYRSTDSTVGRDTLIVKISGGDTLVVSFAGGLLRTKAPYTVDLYRYTDFDGDALLIDPSAEKQQALAFYQRQYPGGRVETLTLAVDAGNDADFTAAEDNRFVFADAAVTLAGDTVSFVQVRDADGDGCIIDYAAAGDSGIVDMIIRSGSENNALPPLQSRVNARMVLFPDDSSKNYAIRYCVANRFAARTVHWLIQTIHGDSTFYPGDTVEVVRSTQPLSGDSLDSDTLVLLAVLGDDPADSLDDALIGVRLHSKFLRGNEREVVFSYETTTPLFTGRKPQDGTVYYKALFRDETWIEADGTIDGAVITADVRTSGGKRYAVSWDTEGSVLTMTEL